MPQVRVIECKDVAGRDFAPSEMFLVVLDQDEARAMCKFALRCDIEKEQSLQKIFNASFRLLNEILD